MRRSCPYRGESHEPGKDVFGEVVTAGPELENCLGPMLEVVRFAKQSEPLTCAQPACSGTRGAWAAASKIHRRSGRAGTTCGDIVDKVLVQSRFLFVQLAQQLFGLGAGRERREPSSQGVWRQSQRAPKLWS